MNAPVPIAQADPCDSTINVPRFTACVNATVREVAQPLTPQLIAELRDDLPDEKKVGCYFVFDSASYVRVIGNNELIAMMDGVQTRYELLSSGCLGSLFGMEMLTDAYLPLDRKVLPLNRVYVMAADGSEGRACNIGS